MHPQAKADPLAVDVFGAGEDLQAIKAAAADKGLTWRFMGARDHADAAMHDYQVGAMWSACVCAHARARECVCVWLCVAVCGCVGRCRVAGVLPSACTPGACRCNRPAFAPPTPHATHRSS
jgi:hypothetical protein